MDGRSGADHRDLGTQAEPLYFPCRWFADLKARRKDWRISYLQERASRGSTLAVHLPKTLKGIRIQDRF